MQNELRKKEPNYKGFKQALQTQYSDYFQYSSHVVLASPMANTVLPSLYLIREYMPQEETFIFGSFNSLLKLNKSENEAYTQLKTEVPLADVLLTAEEYVNNFVRIREQPPGESTFDVDISLDTPLLEE